MQKKTNYLSLTIQKARSELVAESRRGYLGLLWWIIEPLMYLSVFYFIFVIVFDRGGEEHVLFLLTGLVAWKLFAASIPQCSMSIISNAGLIRQVYVPKVLLPVMVVLVNAVKYIFILALLIFFILLIGKDVTPAWFTLPFVIIVHLFLILSVGLMLASLVPFLPDLRVIIDNAMLLLFFLSGIIFDIQGVSEKIQFYLYLNPIVTIVEAYRSILIAGDWPNFLHLGIVFLFSLILLLIGWALLHKYDRVYAKLI